MLDIPCRAVLSHGVHCAASSHGGMIDGLVVWEGGCSWLPENRCAGGYVGGGIPFLSEARARRCLVLREGWLLSVEASFHCVLDARGGGNRWRSIIGGGGKKGREEGWKDGR